LKKPNIEIIPNLCNHAHPNDTTLNGDINRMTDPRNDHTIAVVSGRKININLEWLGGFP